MTCSISNIRFAFFLLFLFLISCSRYPSDVEEVLQSAGSNRQELKKVIDHYKASGEKQKLEAAFFLIGNMMDKHSLYYGYNDRMYELFSSKRDKNRLEIKAELDSIKDASPKRPLVVYDKEVITAEYLIRNIDLAFKVWQEPWSKHFNFDEFCEYILPYRIADEPLSDWRQNLYEEYYWVKDSIKNTANTEEITLYVNDAIAVNFYFDDDYMLDVPFVSVSMLDKVKAGVCELRYLYTISVYRAMGIPAMLDYTPQITRKYEEHTWTAYLTSSHQLRAIDGGHPRDVPFVGNTGFRRAFPDSTIIPLRFGFGPTVYRYTYAIDKRSLAYTIKDKKDIPLKFQSASFKKVTDQYLFRKQDIHISKEPSWTFKNSIAYLAVFTSSQGIRVADWARVKGNAVEFKSIGNGLTYLVCSYENNKLIPLSNPILLNDSAMVYLQPDTVNKETVTLTRKYKPSLEYNNFSNAMVGCIFQGSNDSQFKNATDLFVIDEAPQYMVEKQVNIPEKFRYLRYYSPMKDIRVAEIEFLGKEKPEDKEKRLTGKTICFIRSDTVVSDCYPEQALDENIRTNFNAPAGSWIGLDLGKPQQIMQVSFLPRNNFNVIEPGNEYELFYYEKGWRSLGIQIAKNQYLIYNDVPTNALLLLSNRTQGKEERVFTYEKGKQIFQ